MKHCLSCLIYYMNSIFKDKKLRKVTHTVVDRANQRGVKILRKNMARAAQNRTPPHVVKSYC